MKHMSQRFNQKQPDKATTVSYTKDVSFNIFESFP